MHFDWYSATLENGPDEFLAEALSAFDMSSFRPCTARNGYTHGAEVFRGDEVLCKAYWGGVNGDNVHSFSSGRHSPDFARFIRSAFPRHAVARADVAEDYTEPGTFDLIAKPAVAFAKSKALRLSTAGDWFRKDDPHGRTLYLGSRTSQAFVRLYEKGKQLGADPHWVRLELEAKPSSKELKLSFADLTPQQVWGVAKWTIGLRTLLGKTAPARLSAPPVEPSTFDKALNALGKQYGPTLEKLAERVGGWGAVGLYLETLLMQQALDAEKVAVLQYPETHDARQLVLDLQPRSPLQLDL